MRLGQLSGKTFTLLIATFVIGLFLLLYGVENVALKQHQQTAKILQKKKITQENYFPAGYAVAKMELDVPVLDLEIDGVQESIIVDEDIYHAAKETSVVRITFTRARISRIKHIHDITRIP